MDMQRSTYCERAMVFLASAKNALYAKVVDCALGLFSPTGCVEIDELTEYLLGGQGGLYVFRPVVPVIPDRTLAAADFITDGTWRALDLSDILPKDACCVNVYVRVEDNVSNDILFRRPAGVGVEACMTSLTPGRPVAMVFPVNMGGAQAIEYNAANTAWTTIELTVTGWFTPPQ